MKKPTTSINPDLLKAMIAFDAGLDAYQPPPKLGLIDWADTYRRVAPGTSASPGRWKTSAQPVAFGMMDAITSSDTDTVSVMAATQCVKTELLINCALYYICQDPSPILLVQPTQGAATSFSKERFMPTVEATPALRSILDAPKYRDSDNTITRKAFAGGAIDFVGANSPTDLSSRPKRIILMDEIDKFPLSAGAEGDPLKLGEERASTYKAIGRAKFVRTCSPTVQGSSRIEREYAASDQRKCFLTCIHCGHEQILTWSHVRWSRDEQNGHLPETAAISCEECGSIWSERDRISALNVLQHAPGYGWRQTKPFVCCGETHQPSLWNDKGRSLCPTCQAPSPYNGHAGFHCSKLYSKRHRLPEIVQEFVEAKGDAELLRKWTNTALAELWAPQYAESFDPHALIARAESFGPEDLPEEVRVVTGFCDVQGDRLEIMLAGWGRDMECWVFQYNIIHQDPAQPQAWKELDALLATKFTTISGRPLRVAAFGIDVGGGSGNQVLTYCKQRRGRRIFACKGTPGIRPIWPGRASRSKTNEPFYATGVDTAKDAIYAALKIDPPEPGFRKPGFVHFAVGENMGPEFYEQLNSERRQVRKRMGQSYTVWVQIRERNEVLDCMVGCLAMRKSLPNQIAAGLEFSVSRPEQQEPETGTPRPVPAQVDPEAVRHEAWALARQTPGFLRQPTGGNWVGARKGWFDRE